MFVSKAAVLGGGTMGGEIAQVIAAADIPVVVKDIKQEFVDAALDKSREVTKGQLDKLVSKEKLTQDAADARLDEVMGLITGATDYADFGDVDIVIEAVLEEARAQDAVHISLGTSVDDTEARGLYESTGFTNLEGGDDGPSMLYYERDL